MRLRDLTNGSAARCVLAGFLLLFGSILSVASETNASPGILFLQIKLNRDQTATLVKSIATPGTLKPTPEINDGLHYELQDANGKSLWQASTVDPRTQVLEHADRAHPGTLKSLTNAVTEAEFTVRVPALTNAARIEFYQLVGAATNSATGKIRLGAIPLPRK
jgi:hypothetical protein